MNINRVVISGNLSRDPELRSTASGLQVMSVSVAVNERRRGASGAYQNYTNWVGCKMFGERAEKVAPLLKKGMKVCIDGKLSYSSWEKNGERRSSIEVLIKDIEFIEPKTQQQEQVERPVFDDDIPF